MIKHLRKNPKQIAKQEVINVGVQTLVLDESRLAEHWPPGLIYEPHEEKKKKKRGKGDLVSSAQTPGGFRSSCQHYLMLRPRSIPSLHPERAVTWWLVAAAAGCLQLPL